MDSTEGLIHYSYYLPEDYDPTRKYPEYYGVQKARDAYNGLHDAYAAAGWTDEQIDTVLQMQTPGNAFFDAQGLHVYHAAANVVFDDADILNWIVSKHK